jgi:hypothetical protein
MESYHGKGEVPSLILGGLNLDYRKKYHGRMKEVIMIGKIMVRWFKSGV